MSFFYFFYIKLLKSCKGLNLLVHDLVIQALPVLLIKVLFSNLHEKHLRLASHFLFELNMDKLLMRFYLVDFFSLMHELDVASSAFGLVEAISPTSLLVGPVTQDADQVFHELEQF